MSSGDNNVLPILERALSEIWVISVNISRTLSCNFDQKFCSCENKKLFFHLRFNEILNEKQISWLISVTLCEQQGMLYKRETLLVWWGTLMCFSHCPTLLCVLCPLKSGKNLSHWTETTQLTNVGLISARLYSEVKVLWMLADASLT